MTLLIFLLLHFLTGLLPPPSFPAAPALFTLVGKSGAWLDRRLNRENRTKRDLALRGAVVAALFLALATEAGRAVQAIPAPLHAGIAAVAVLFLTSALMQPLNVLRAAARALKDKDSARAATLLRPPLPALPDKADDFTLARKAVEWSAVSLNAWFTGPLLCFAVAGPKGALIYATVAALRASLAPDDARHAYFGLAVRWTDDALNFFSGAVTVFGIALSAVFVSGANPLRALSTVIKRGRNTPRGTGEWPIAAMAGALGITLGGPPHDWIGPEGGSAKVTPEDLERGALLHFVFFLCTMALVSSALLATNFSHILK